MHELDSTPFVDPAVMPLGVEAALAAPAVVAVGGSAGALQVMRALAQVLPADFPAAVLMVLHVSADSPGVLADIINASGPLPASYPHAGERACPGHIYLAPPDFHLLLDPDPEGRGFRLNLSRGARENRNRPSIDVLFRSVAHQAGALGVGVVLSGMLDDGAAGAAAIKAAGGRMIVQDPASAQSPDMPENALRRAGADAVVTPGQIGGRLLEMVRDGQAAAAHGEAVGKGSGHSSGQA